MQEEFDTYDDNAHLFVKLQFLKRRSKVIEIVAAKDMIFALANSGLCAAFNRGKCSENGICMLHNLIKHACLLTCLYTLCLQ